MLRKTLPHFQPVSVIFPPLNREDKRPLGPGSIYNINPFFPLPGKQLGTFASKRFPQTDFFKNLPRRKVMNYFSQKGEGEGGGGGGSPTSFWWEHAPKNILNLKNRTSWAKKVTMSVSPKILQLDLWSEMLSAKYCLSEPITTVFVDRRHWKTKHPRKRFQNFRQSYVLSTDRIEIHQSQPLVWPSDLLYGMLAGCDWWISIRHVDNT